MPDCSPTQAACLDAFKPFMIILARIPTRFTYGYNLPVLVEAGTVSTRGQIARSAEEVAGHLVDIARHGFTLLNLWPGVMPRPSASGWQGTCCLASTSCWRRLCLAPKRSPAKHGLGDPLHTVRWKKTQGDDPLRRSGRGALLDRAQRDGLVCWSWRSWKRREGGRGCTTPRWHEDVEPTIYGQRLLPSGLSQMGILG